MAGDREIYAPFATHLNFLSRSTVVRLSSSRPYASSVTGEASYRKLSYILFGAVGEQIAPPMPVKA